MAMKISRDLDTFCPIRRKHGTRFVLRFRVFSSLIKSCLSLLHHSVTQHPCEYACCSQPEGISMRCWGSVTSMPKYFEAHFQALLVRPKTLSRSMRTSHCVGQLDIMRFKTVSMGLSFPVWLGIPVIIAECHLALQMWTIERNWYYWHGNSLASYRL